MKTTHLLSLLLTLTLLLGIAPTVRTIEPLNRLNAADATEQLPFGLAVQVPAERQDRPFSAVGVPSSPAMVQSPTNDWHIECVDCPKRFGDMTSRSLWLDTEGHPHIAYGGDHLYYAWYDGAEWHYETVDESPQVGKYASLALDAAGRPHISYYDTYNKDLKHAWHNGTTWHVDTVDSEGWVGRNTSLTLDGAGQPHISYLTTYDLKYARYDGTTWQIEIVDSDEYMSGSTSLALDGTGQPHITYCDFICMGKECTECTNLKYARHDGMSWRIETVDNTGERAWGDNNHSSLALDGAGRPHVSYYDWGNDRLKYAWHDGTGWRGETVDSGGYDNSLTLDEAGRPHISYSGGGLKYARHDGTTWQIETVDSEGSDTSLTLDGAGQPHISYYDDTNNDLKYTRHDGTTWQIEIVDSARGGDGYSSYYSSLALDEMELPHISYYDLDGNLDLKYTWYDGSTWQIETVDSEGDVGKGTSLALDGAGRPHISYYDATNSDLKYAWHDGASWQIETVDSEGDVGEHTSLALDETGHPCISYRSGYPATNLKYAWYNGTNWQIETVDIQGDVGTYTSLVLDGAGRPHISYSGYPNGDLKYTWHDGMTWHTEIVDSAGYGAFSTSLALDRAGHPHISYGSFKYAWHNGESWHIEIVDSGDEGWDDTSLALDGVGRPHISYYDATNKDLKHAWRDGTAWHTETVDSEGDVGKGTSLALDGVGRPHISYLDHSIGDLKYAWRLPFLLDKQVTPSDSLDDINASTHVLTYSLALVGSGQDFVLQDPLPGAVRYVSHSITSTLTPPAVYSPTLNAVVWKGTLPVHTTQTVRFRVTPEVTSTRFLSATLPIVNTAWLTATEGGWSIADTAVVIVTPPPLALDKQASFDGVRLYNGDLLTYTLAFTGPDLNVRLWDPLPDAVRYISGSLTSTLTPPPVYSPTARAVVWQGRLPTDTIETARFQAIVNVGNVSDEGPSWLPLINAAWLTATESGRSVSATASVDVMIPPSTDRTYWRIETVYSQGDVDKGTSLALDEVGHPHISYYDRDNDNLKYTWHNGTNWHSETVDSEGDVGKYTSLALDEAGHPHISYFDHYPNWDLKYAWHNGANWQIETVDSEGWVGIDTSLALDEAGHPHISYYNLSNYDLKYAWHNGANWQIEIVDSQGEVGAHSSLALDEAGHPHISYYNDTNNDLKYAWRDGTNWQIETVDSKVNVGEYTSLALDETGHPHISYYDDTNNDLKYAWHDETTWHIETVDSQGNVGMHTSLALDGAGHPHISYYDRDNDNLKYAWHDETNWQIETVDSEGEVGEYTSLALDGAGYPHISYHDGYPNYDLKYAWRPPFSLVKQVASSDSPDDANALTHTLTYSLTLVGPDLNARLRDPIPDDVNYVPGSITSTLTPPAVYSPSLDAVIWKGVLPFGTVQTVYFQVALEVTNARFLSEPLSITNTAWMDDLTHDKRVLDTAVVTITPPPLVLRQRVTPAHGLRNNDTLTYTLTLYGPGLRARLWDPLPPSVRYVSGSITDTIGRISGTLTLPAAVYSPTAHAILWQGTLPTDTVEVIRFQATPGITGTDSLSLSLPIVNTAWLTATESGRSVSATAIVNGDYYVYLPLTLRDD